CITQAIIGRRSAAPSRALAWKRPTSASIGSGSKRSRSSRSTPKAGPRCLGLTPEQLETPVPGTYGSILSTLRHFLQGDSFYLFVASNHWEESADTSTMSL